MNNLIKAFSQNACNVAYFPPQTQIMLDWSVCSHTEVLADAFHMFIDLKPELVNLSKKEKWVGLPPVSVSVCRRGVSLPGSERPLCPLLHRGPASLPGKLGSDGVAGPPVGGAPWRLGQLFGWMVGWSDCPVRTRPPPDVHQLHSSRNACEQ